MKDFERLSREADAAGFRLEVVRGLATVEASPVWRHQKNVDRIRASIKPAVLEGVCGCVHGADIQIRFPDDSRRRPDIAIFCREPEDQDSETTLLPEAVIEIISKGYEAKDLVIGVPFYQQVGIRDIVVFDPETNEVRHWQTGQGEKVYTSPAPLAFLCGCTATV